jgi:hypothetical protein
LIKKQAGSLRVNSLVGGGSEVKCLRNTGVAYKAMSYSDGVAFGSVLWKIQEGKQRWVTGTERMCVERFFVSSRCVSSSLLHGPSHIGTMTDLISHFATVAETLVGAVPPCDRVARGLAVKRE